MNFFSNDIMKGMMNMMSNNDSWGGSGGSSKEATLRSNLERCTYPDEYLPPHAGPSGSLRKPPSSSSTSTPSSIPTSSCSVLLRPCSRERTVS